MRARLALRPLTPHIGAEIDGIDLTEPLDDSTIERIRDALLHWKVIFFRDQHLSRDQQIAFGQYFGDVTKAHPTMPTAVADHPEIFVLDNESDSGEGLCVERRWHTDVTFVRTPPMAAILRAVAVPQCGGDTHWADMVMAYATLSPSLQKLCDELHAVHTNALPVVRGELPESIRQAFQVGKLRAVHPVVRVNPETGEKALFVNPLFTSHIVEVSRHESAYLLEMLYKQISNPAYTCAFRWEPGSLAFWDNRVTSHLAPANIPVGARRTLERITLAGDVPMGPTDLSLVLKRNEPIQ